MIILIPLTEDSEKNNKIVLETTCTYRDRKLIYKWATGNSKDPLNITGNQGQFSYQAHIAKVEQMRYYALTIAMDDDFEV
jgi:hypothetical protein